MFWTYHSLAVYYYSVYLTNIQEGDYPELRYWTSLTPRIRERSTSIHATALFWGREHRGEAYQAHLAFLRSRQILIRTLILWG
jgi:hypothetical protein